MPQGPSPLLPGPGTGWAWGWELCPPNPWPSVPSGERKHWPPMCEALPCTSWQVVARSCGLLESFGQLKDIALRKGYQPRAVVTELPGAA